MLTFLGNIELRRFLPERFGNGCGSSTVCSNMADMRFSLPRFGLTGVDGLVASAAPGKDADDASSGGGVVLGVGVAFLVRFARLGRPPAIDLRRFHALGFGLVATGGGADMMAGVVRGDKEASEEVGRKMSV